MSQTELASENQHTNIGGEQAARACHLSQTIPQDEGNQVVPASASGDHSVQLLREKVPLSQNENGGATGVHLELGGHGGDSDSTSALNGSHADATVLTTTREENLIDLETELGEINLEGLWKAKLFNDIETAAEARNLSYRRSSRNGEDGLDNAQHEAMIPSLPRPPEIRLDNRCVTPDRPRTTSLSQRMYQSPGSPSSLRTNQSHRSETYHYTYETPARSAPSPVPPFVVVHSSGSAIVTVRPTGRAPNGPTSEDEEIMFTNRALVRRACVFALLALLLLAVITIVAGLLRSNEMRQNSGSAPVDPSLLLPLTSGPSIVPSRGIPFPTERPVLAVPNDNGDSVVVIPPLGDGKTVREETYSPAYVAPTRPPRTRAPVPFSELPTFRPTFQPTPESSTPQTYPNDIEYRDETSSPAEVQPTYPPNGPTESQSIEASAQPTDESTIDSEGGSFWDDTVSPAEVQPTDPPPTQLLVSEEFSNAPSTQPYNVEESDTSNSSSAAGNDGGSLGDETYSPAAAPPTWPPDSEGGSFWDDTVSPAEVQPTDPPPTQLLLSEELSNAPSTQTYDVEVSDTSNSPSAGDIDGGSLGDETYSPAAASPTWPLWTHTPISDPTTHAPSIELSEIGTPLLTPAQSNLLGVIAQMSPSSIPALSDFTSPQYRAFNWVSLDPSVGNETFSARQITQRWVLATFFFSTNGENWTNSGGWVTHNTSECKWYSSRAKGDVCDSEGNVEIIELRRNGLNGSLPLELGLLSDSLDQIWLHKNDIDGTLPPELSALHELKFLHLTKNDIGGTIPPEYGKLTNLVLLELGDNEMRSTLPTELGNLNRLGTLGLERNSMRGTIPTEFGNLNCMQYLSFCSNRFSGEVPSELGSLQLLIKLSLSGNHFDGSMPQQICNLTVTRPYALTTLTADCDAFECDCCQRRRPGYLLRKRRLDC